MCEAGRAVAALIALAGFLVGVPAGNLATGGAPDRLLLHAVPDLTAPDAGEHVWEAVRWSYMDGTLIPWLAHTLAWCGWALGVFLILLDLARLLHAGGIAAARHLAGRSPRTWITGLVASALLVFSATNAVAAPTGPQVVASADQHPEPATPRPDPYRVPDDVRPDCPRHQVVLGDTYWSLAETHLGDGRRYVEIDGLNRDRIPDFHRLLPGMAVLLPPDATNLLPPLPAGVREVVVAPGETASSIALREYGDPNAWHRLWDLNHDRPQPDGRAWRTPNLLLPGWHLAITEPEAAPSPPSPPSQPVPPIATPPSTTSAPTPASATAPTPTAAPHPATAVDLPTGAFVGIGLAALVTAAAITTRLWHRRHYRPGSGDRSDLVTAPIVH